MGSADGRGDLYHLQQESGMKSSLIPVICDISPVIETSEVVALGQSKPQCTVKKKIGELGMCNIHINM